MPKKSGGQCGFEQRIEVIVTIQKKRETSGSGGGRSGFGDWGESGWL